MRLFTATLLLVGCSEYGLGSGQDPHNRYDDDGNYADPTDDGSQVDTAADTNEDPFDDPGKEEPYGDIPDTFLDDCTDGDTASFAPDQIYVLAWDPMRAEGTLYAERSGWFDVYNLHLHESGDRQWNESAYFRVQSSERPEGEPYWANCAGREWIVKDRDNTGSPPGTRVYIGTFYLDEGPNPLIMHHYCGLQRAGECPGFHIEANPESTCDTGNPNSVHFEGHGVCLIPSQTH